jgi:hypothetical protein
VQNWPSKTQIEIARQLHLQRLRLQWTMHSWKIANLGQLFDKHSKHFGRTLGFELRALF